MTFLEEQYRRQIEILKQENPFRAHLVADYVEELEFKLQGMNKVKKVVIKFPKEVDIKYEDCTLFINGSSDD